EAPLGLAEGEYVRLVNPISSERVVMRHSVLAGVLDVAAANLRHANEVRLFEIGSVYLPQPGEKLPREPRRLAVVLNRLKAEAFGADAGAARPEFDFFDLKGIVEALATDLHLPHVSYRLSNAVYLHPGQAAELALHGQPVGQFGRLHPKAAQAYGIGGATLAG